MVDHPIIINVHIRTTNDMQLITDIYVKWNALLEVELSYHTIQAINLNKLKKYKENHYYP